MIRRRTSVPLLVAILTLSLFAPTVSVSAQNAARPTITNDDVIQMVTANLSESLILSQIADSQTRFDLSTPELIRLSTSGVSDTIIAAMRTSSSPADTRPAQPVVAPVVEPPDAAVVAPVSQAPGNADDEPTSITADAARAAGQVRLAQGAPQERQRSMGRVLGGLALVGGGVALAFYSKSCEATGDLSGPRYADDPYAPGLISWTFLASGLEPLVTDGRCGVDFNMRGIQTGNYTGSVYFDETVRSSKFAELGFTGVNSPTNMMKGDAAGHSFYPKGRMYAGLGIAAAGLLVATLFSDVPVVNSLTVAPRLGGAQVNASLGF
jgi:hypothetical protein